MPTASDPRYVRSRERLLDAARIVLADEGPSGVTHARVAEVAGVGRATVYRHWASGEDMLADAMASVPLPFFANPAVPAKPWLRAELSSLARELESDPVRAVATTLASAALWSGAMDARRERFAAVLVERLSAALHAAHERGEVELTGDAADAAARAIGPLYYRSTIERRPVDEALIEAVVSSLGRWREASA